MGERIEAHVLEGAEARAKQVEETLQAAYASKSAFHLSEPQVASFLQLATDLRRLAGEVRRLLAVHERAKELLDAAMDRAYHTQARLLRLGTGPHVPTVSDAEAEARWSALVAMLRDNGLPYQGSSVFAEHDKRIRELRAQLDGARASYDTERRAHEAARKDAEVLREQRDEARHAEADTNQALLVAQDEVTRLKRKVNRLVRRLWSERDAREKGLLAQLAQVIAREVRRGGA